MDTIDGAAAEGAGMVVISASIEAEIAQLSDDEQADAIDGANFDTRAVFDALASRHDYVGHLFDPCVTEAICPSIQACVFPGMLEGLLLSPRIRVRRQAPAAFWTVLH